MKKVAVIIPFYRDIITDYEKIALQQCEHILSAHPKIAVKPHSLILPETVGLINFDDVISFNDDYFKSLAGYNRLMLSAEFYKQLMEYEYMLVYQMDCFTFKDELTYWCNQNLDYIGAPWIRKTYHKNAVELLLVKIQQYFAGWIKQKNSETPNQYQLNNRVGNGGFSLRRVKKFYDACTTMKPVIDFYLSQKGNLYNEDVFWSIEVNRRGQVLNIPSCQTGLKFAFEVPPVKPHLLNDENLPFGCHDWDRYDDFWRPVFKQYGYNI
jgi:hypothetical protein